MAWIALRARLVTRPQDAEPRRLSSGADSRSLLYLSTVSIFSTGTYTLSSPAKTSSRHSRSAPSTVMRRSPL